MDIELNRSGLSYISLLKPLQINVMLCYSENARFTISFLLPDSTKSSEVQNIYHVFRTMKIVLIKIIKIIIIIIVEI